jgi:RimJ/RimL family protein N-acetyltransferase
MIKVGAVPSAFTVPVRRSTDVKNHTTTMPAEGPTYVVGTLNDRTAGIADLRPSRASRLSIALGARKCYQGDVPDLTSSDRATPLETPRLLLRGWQDGDLDGFAAVNAQPEVMRYIHDGRTLDRAATAERMATYRRHWAEHGFGLYVVEIKESGELAGFTGLAVPAFLPEIMPAVEIGWRLGRAHWGQGLATEAARAVVAHTRSELALRRLVSIHVVGNEASARVMVKLGMSVERETVQPDTGRQVRVYAMDL